jgi:DNA replication protein DnaC
MLRHSGVEYSKYAAMSFDTWRADTDEARHMRDVAQAFLADADAQGFGCFGNAGSGKTHICIAVCQAWTHKTGKLHLYMPWVDESRTLRALRYRADEYAERIRRFEEAPLLYIDDLFKGSGRRDPKTGAVMMDDWSLSMAFEVVNARYISKRPTVFSSEYRLNELVKADEAVAGRIYHMCMPHIVRCDGADRRLLARIGKGASA